MINRNVELQKYVVEEILREGLDNTTYATKQLLVSTEIWLRENGQQDKGSFHLLTKYTQKRFNVMIDRYVESIIEEEIKNYKGETK